MDFRKTWYRYAVWLASCMGLSWWFFTNNRASDVFTKEYIVDDHHVAPWGVLFLCLLWLFLKKSEIGKNLQERVSKIDAAVGLGLLFLSLRIPAEPEFFVLKLLVGCLGLFAVFFGRAFLLPAKLLSVYALTILLPVAIESYLERPYALAAALPAAAVTKLIGLPVTADRQMLTVETLSGKSISVLVTGACAGPTTLAVFIAIFLLMMMDMRLNNKAAAGVFLFGAAGTWVQNIVRIVVIMASGHYGGEPYLWQAHFWTIYLLFPLWYLVFTAVYFKVLSRTQTAAAH